MLAQLLGSKSRAAILARLVVAPDHRAHLRELVRASGGSVSSVQRELERMSDMGLVRTWLDEDGRRQVSLVAEHPFAHSLAGMVAADPRAQYEARASAIPNLDPGIDAVLGGVVDTIVSGFDPIEIVLFGSQARGTADADSDIDILVVLPDLPKDSEASVALRAAIGVVGTGIDVIAVDTAGVQRAAGQSSSVVRHARDEGVTLYGRPA